MKMQVTNTSVKIDHDLQTNSGQQIQWVRPDGTVRIPEEQDRIFTYPGSFTAAGRKYQNLHFLCVGVGSGPVYRDIYGREVFCVAKRFPCFDSYDAMYETRHYRWFFIKESGRLTRVYYSDGRNRIQVTEDVRDLEELCREQMEAYGWL